MPDLTGAQPEYTYIPSGAVASLETYTGEEIVSDMEHEYDLRGHQIKKTAGC